MTGAAPWGMILAGGAGRRLGGGPKAHWSLGSRSLLHRVIEALAPQTSRLVVAAGPHRLDCQLEQVPDLCPERGPLEGIRSVMHRHGRAQWLVAPVDCLPLPPDLWPRLFEPADEPLCCVTSGGRLQPLLGRWSGTLAGDIGAYLDGGGRSLKGLLETVSWHTVAMPHTLVNVNTPADARRLEAML